MKEKYVECLVYTLLFAIAIIVHYGLSFIFVDYTEGWTQMQIFGCLAWMAIMMYMLMVVLTLVRNREDNIEVG